jgi:2-C-methyl-D-erythritol 4-phosphate cytidylyltransferase
MAANGCAIRASVIIVAAGVGSRLGHATAKAFVDLCGHPMLYYSLAAVARVPGVIEVVVAVPAGMQAAARGAVRDAGLELPVKITPGGHERQESVGIALEITSAESDLVAVHDAARPFAPPQLFADLLACAFRYGAAVAAVPVADTLKRAEAGVVSGTLPRQGLFQSQTPQAFRRTLLINAFKAAQEKGWHVTDDAELVERAGGKVRLVDSSRENFKVTTPEDLMMAEMLIAARRRSAI